MTLHPYRAMVLFGLASVMTGCAGMAPNHQMPTVPPDQPPSATNHHFNLPPPRPAAPMPPVTVPELPSNGLPLQAMSAVIGEPNPEDPWDDYVGSSRIQLAAVQTLIDREHFSPGVIDGIWGSKSESALKAWQKKHGLTPTGQPDRPTLDALAPLKRAFLSYQVTDADHGDLALVPDTWLGKSRAERLGYESVEEKLAERFHCSRALLRLMNPNAAWPNPLAGTNLRVPNILPSPYPAVSRIEIRLSEKTVRLLDADESVLALFPCSIGRDRAKVPRGELHVVAWAENPSYYFDPAVFPEDPEARSLHQKLVLPPGPNNPVGTAWISLSLPGYGIHGTPNPEDIGKTESHGCFRLANWNAEKLLRMVRPGMPVLILE